MLVTITGTFMCSIGTKVPNTKFRFAILQGSAKKDSSLLWWLRLRHRAAKPEDAGSILTMVAAFHM